MYTKNIAGAFFAILIISFVGYILYWGSTKPISVIVQAGHEGRVSGNTGAESALYREAEWNIIVADEVAKKFKREYFTIKGLNVGLVSPNVYRNRKALPPLFGSKLSVSLTV